MANYSYSRIDINFQPIYEQKDSLVGLSRSGFIKRTKIMYSEIIEKKKQQSNFIEQKQRGLENSKLGKLKG